jgi:hypothetical protein
MQSLLQPRPRPLPTVDEKKFLTALNAVMKAAVKCGIPEAAANRLVNNAKIKAAIKAR